MGRTEELVRTTFLEPTQTDDRAGTREVGRALTSGLEHGQRRELRHLRPDGTPVWVDVSVSAVPGNVPRSRC